MSLILDLLFPKSCLKCGKSGRYFCQKCLDQELILSPHLLTDPIHEGNLCLFKYRSIIKKGITELKYHFVTDLSDELSEICANLIKNKYPHILEYWQQNQFVIIPIPLHQSRLNWRGFNQSTLLSQKVAKLLQLPFSDVILQRSINTSAQVKLKRKSDRYRNIKEAFRLNEKISNPPKNIILFDDVMTTGSTLNSALKVFDLNHCWFLTIAR